MTALGIDIGGSAVKMACIDATGASRCLASDAYERPTIQQLREIIGGLWARLDEGVPLTSIGVAVPGPVEVDTLICTASMPALVGVHAADFACEVVGTCVPAGAFTDSVSAAAWEHAVMPYAGRALYVSIGTGVGAAVLDDGVPVLITRGTPGHLGHIDVSGGERDAPHLPGACRGALQSYIGIAGLRAMGVPVEAEDCFAHPAASRAVAALARAVRIALAIYRPTRITFMGGLGIKLGPAMPMLEKLVRQDLGPAAPQQFELRISTSDRFAAARGAATLAAKRGEQTHV